VSVRRDDRNHATMILVISLLTEVCSIFISAYAYARLYYVIQRWLRPQNVA